MLVETKLTITVVHFEVMELQLLLTHVARVNMLLVLLHVLLFVVNPSLVLVQYPLPSHLPSLLRWPSTLLNWHTSSLGGTLARCWRLTLELLR